MSRLTLRLPETLHSQLKTVAQREGVSLNQYIVYALTRQVTLAYTVQAVPENTVEQQRAQFKELLQNLEQASDAEIKDILAEREIVEPEAELSPDVVARLQKRMTSEWSSASK
ncbi:toxin-antitoxin system HicB family antitoxin [Candidatus Poribacteria bacterium]|nr:toxin-antitoxin system HicB family antitoxin [Candidatus Poribacteria bacterium]